MDETDASRLPALKRGPKTGDGRRAVALNSLRHGLYSDAIVIPGIETEDAWRCFYDDVVERIGPDGVVESSLATTVAELLWRIRRLPRAERDFICDAHDVALADERRRVERLAQREKNYAQLKARQSFYASAFAPDPYEPKMLQHVEPRVLPPETALQSLVRYEAHLYRQLYHALRELEALQARRNGEPSSLARVDVHGVPG